MQYYSYFVSTQDKEHHSRSSLSDTSVVCTQMEEHGFPKWLFVLQICDYCGPLVSCEIKTDLS